MVKGSNWVTKEERTNKKTKGPKGSKLADQENKRVQQTDSILKSIVDNIDLSSHRLEAWIRSDNGKMFCFAHFRADACRSKRCKYSHEFTIAAMDNVIYTEEANAKGSERTELCMTHIPDAASLIGKEECKKIAFLFLSGTCIFDYANPRNWHQWKNEHCSSHNRLYPDSLNSIESGQCLVRQLRPISEIACEHEDDIVNPNYVDEADGKERGTSVDLDITISSLHSKLILDTSTLGNRNFPPLLCKFPGSILKIVLSFLERQDMDALFQFSQSSNTLNHDVVETDTHNYELSTPSSTAEIKLLSKRRKEERKKKVKNAFISKSNRKDRCAYKY